MYSSHKEAEFSRKRHLINKMNAVLLGPNGEWDADQMVFREGGTERLILQRKKSFVLTEVEISLLNFSSKVQMERFSYQCNLFHISIRERAHRKTLLEM